MLTTDNDLFSSANAYHVEARLYKINVKDVAGSEDVPVIVALRHPLTGFTRPMTPLECEMIETYHRFEVSKKGLTKKPIIFHVYGDVKKCVEQRK